MKIKGENELLCIQLLSNGNFGAASGNVTLDRPTQVEAYSGLPFIPNSSLRGVLKAVSKLSDQQLSVAFGVPDINEQDSHGFSQAGELILGNGDLLTFPVLADNGERCWIFPVDQIFKFIAMEKLCGISTDIRKLAGAFYPQPDRHSSAVLGIPQTPLLNLPLTLIQINPADFKDEINQLYRLICRWCANWFMLRETLMIVDNLTTRFLWYRAAEVRTLTALDKNKVALSQSLRKIETIPEGSIFLALITYLGSRELAFDDHVIQFGSAEGSGLGFCRLEIVGTAVPDITPPSFSVLENSGQLVQDYDTMMAMHAVIVNLKATDDEELNKKARAAIGDLSWRLNKEGWESALAFALARAKPSSSQDKLEIRVYRRLLAALFQIPEEEIRNSYQDWFSESFTVTHKRLIMERCRWLRKYGEYELRA